MQHVEHGNRKFSENYKKLENITEMLHRRHRSSRNWWCRPLEPTFWAAVGCSLDLMTFVACCNGKEIVVLT